MKQELENYINFFHDQISEMVVEYRHLLRVPMKQLLSNGNVYYAVVHTLSVQRGHVILKIDKAHCPRLKVQQSFVIIKRAARERWGDNPPSWNCSFEEFLSKEEYHSSSTLVTPLYYLDCNDPNCRLVGCGGVSARMFRKIQNALKEGIVVRVLVYETEPPTRYLANLADYIESNQDDALLLATQKIRYDQWSPKLLAYDKNDPSLMARTLIAALKESKRVVLQGPPGTGKSYCAAQVVADYLIKGMSVCVTAMANKALMELIVQPPLKEFLTQGKLSKTMLTSDEAALAKGLKDADSGFVAPKGEAVFATYYKFSNQFRHAKGFNTEPLYDLVVVEEASQSYLTTIAAVNRLSRETLVVGDPMQLSPIVVSENKAEYKRWNSVTQSEGLSTYVLGTDVNSFRITTTFRLTPASAALTGIFYGSSLRSVAPSGQDWSSIDKEIFPVGGGVVCRVMAGGEDGVLSNPALEQIKDVVSKLQRAKQGASLAIITPFKDSAKAIQSNFSSGDVKLDILVETIDRVQGATVDYTIIYFPLRNAGFALNDRRFNVATSRSRTTTLIVSDFDLLSMRSISGKVREFLARVCDKESAVEHPVEVCRGAMHRSEEIDALVSNASEVRQKMDVVQARLGQWLEGWLTIIYPTDIWKNAVAKNLSEIQYQNARQRGIRKIMDLDLNALISVFLGNFRELQSVSHIEDEMLSLAHLVRDIRHNYSHIRTSSLVTPKVQQTQHHLDNLSQFLDGLDATAPEAKKVTGSKTIVTKAGMTITVS